MDLGITFLQYFFREGDNQSILQKIYNLWISIKNIVTKIMCIVSFKRLYYRSDALFDSSFIVRPKILYGM